MRTQVILDSSFARLGSAPIWGGKKGEFRDWTTVASVVVFMGLMFSASSILSIEQKTCKIVSLDNVVQQC